MTAIEATIENGKGVARDHGEKEDDRRITCSRERPGTSTPAPGCTVSGGQTVARTMVLAGRCMIRRPVLPAATQHAAHALRLGRRMEARHGPPRRGDHDLDEPSRARRRRA